MGDFIQNEIERITGQKSSMPKIEDERVAKSQARKAVEKFFEMDVDDVKRAVKKDLKRRMFGMLGDGLNNIIDIVFRGKGSGNTKASNYGPNVYVRGYSDGTYTNYSSPATNTASAPKTGAKYSFSDLVFAQRSQAQHLKDIMEEKILMDGSLSVMELYDALGDPSNLEPTDNNFGWKSLEGAYITEENGLYRLYLPKVMSLK